MTSTREIERIADGLPAAYAWRMHQPNGLLFHDFFCGAGARRSG